MEIKISREELKQGLYWTQNVVEKKTTKPILSNALIEASGERLKLSATDLEVGISVEVPAQVKSGGQVAVPAKSLYDIVREITAEQISIKRRDDHWLEISAGSSKFKVVGLSPQEFPSMPEMGKKNVLTLDAPALRAMIEKTLFSVSTDETKYNLNGVFLESAGDKKLRMVATDGHRLSWAERPMTQSFQLAKGVLLPRKGVLELQKLIQEEDGILPLAIEGRNVMLQRGPITLFIRLIEGDFPDYRQVIPAKNDQSAILPKAQLVGALRRVSLLSQEHNRGVKLTFNSGQLELLCSNPDLGEAREEVECQYKGKHFEVGFNYRYFLDVLSVLEDETVKLELKDEVSPCLIRSEVDKGFLSLIMPMRL
ncbi:MAG TPA: DNA polymerase III subunit beta [bacterium]|nr:DNA polymerase III subunit beta [bacterium]